MIENIRVALNGLGSNRLRTVLTMLGVTIGTAAVIILISLGQAVQGYIVGQFSGLGTNLIFVAGTLDRFNRPKPLTEKDLIALSDIYRVPDALRVTGYFVASQTETGSTEDVVYGGQQTKSQVVGVTQDYIKLVNLELTEGRFIEPGDNATGSRVAVIGAAAAENLFGNLSPINQEIRVGTLRFQVIGVLKRIGGASAIGPGGGADGRVYVPLTTAQLRMNSDRTTSGERPITGILLQARDENSVKVLSDEITQTLREQHKITGKDENDFQVATQDELLSSIGAITGLLTIFLGVIAGISLLVGGIGIMNIMLVTVTERTREVGLRKAVGAKRPAILLQFLTEAITLAMIGGAIGVGIAAGFTSLVTSLVPDLHVSVQLSSVLLATFISVAIGVFFGIYPANRAATLNPIDALRYE